MGTSRVIARVPSCTLRNVHGGDPVERARILDQENTKALNSPPPAVATQAADLPADPQVARARTAWSALGLKLRRITPSQLSRFVLAITVGVALLGLTVSLLQVLVPFEIGLVLAYVTIPLVDWLDKRVPRSVAVALVMLAEFALLATFVGLLVPILINQVGVVLSDLPSQDQRRRFFNDLITSLQAVLPPEAQDFVKNAVQQTTADIEQNAATYLSTIVGIIGGAVLGVIGSISFALSLLVLPTWLFAVLRDRKSGVRFIN